MGGGSAASSNASAYASRWGRKGNCLDNAVTKQVFGHLKDEFHGGRTFGSYELFRAELDAYIVP